ncbi:peptidoglycan-binding protein [Geminicoccaceae bacterium 1502E]|nr:peptidoglycan-binding protein [Geminicoccaceae bacterium 1502E]
MRPVLRRGSRGYEVERLQQRLEALGFPPGRLDGRFGAATEAALLACQRANGLLADGICGPMSWSLIEPGGRAAVSDVTQAVDVDLVSALFPFTPLGPIARNLPAVLAGLRAFGLVEKPLVLAALATIRAESEGFEPVEEQLSRFNSSPGGHPFDLYDQRRDLGNRGAPDGARFRGRGFVQLTGRANYRRHGRLLGLDHALLEEPELACEPAIAGRLLGSFLASRRLALKEALFEGDLRRARRLVNGGTHGLDRFTDAWRRGCVLLADPVWSGDREAVPA